MICCGMAVREDGDVSTECEEDEGTDCKDGYSETGL